MRLYVNIESPENPRKKLTINNREFFAELVNGADIIKITDTESTEIIIQTIELLFCFKKPYARYSN